MYFFLVVVSGSRKTSQDSDGPNLDIQAEQVPGFKTMLCRDFVSLGRCGVENCAGAHGREELRTPARFKDSKGYKASYCTFFMADDLECQKESHNCFEAHGPLDLRKPVLTVPPEINEALCKTVSSYTSSLQWIHV